MHTTNLRNSALNAIEQAREALQDHAAALGEHVEDARIAVKRHVRNHPMQTAAVAGLAGVVIGLLISRR